MKPVTLSPEYVERRAAGFTPASGPPDSPPPNVPAVPDLVQAYLRSFEAAILQRHSDGSATIDVDHPAWAAALEKERLAKPGERLFPLPPEQQRRIDALTSMCRTCRYCLGVEPRRVHCAATSAACGCERFLMGRCPKGRWAV
jgi:hypothetical protein